MKTIKTKNLKKSGFEILNKNPLVVYFYGVFSNQECDDIINENIEYESCMGYFPEDHDEDNIRTSDIGFSKKGELINNKISKLTNQDANKMEDTEILRYKPGQKFNTHHDYLNRDPTEVCTNNDRVATSIAYLDDDFEGGTTIFPELNIEVKPKKGCVLYFEYDEKSNRHKTIHSGEEVTKGVKHIAVTCIRGNVYDPYDEAAVAKAWKEPNNPIKTTSIKRFGVDELSSDPLILYYHGIFSDRECDEILSANLKYVRAEVVREDITKCEISKNRTNSVSYEADDFRINLKISKLTKKELYNIENIQILKYEKGQEFKKHCDFLGIDNDRIATAITYLNDDFEGGETEFHKLGVKIKPQKGSVLYFEYNESNKKKTLHSGNKVTSGIKYVASTWIREKEIKS